MDDDSDSDSSDCGIIMDDDGDGSSNSNRTVERRDSSSNSSDCSIIMDDDGDGSSNSNRTVERKDSSSSSSESGTGHRAVERKYNSSSSKSCWLSDSNERNASGESDNDSERDFQWRLTTSGSIEAVTPPRPSGTSRHEITVWPPSSTEPDVPEFMRWAFHTPVTAPTAISSDISGDSDDDDDDYRASSSNTSAFFRDPRTLPRFRRIRRSGSKIHFADKELQIVSRMTRRITRNNGYLAFSQIKPRSEIIERLDASTLLQLLSLVPDVSVQRHKRALSVLLYNILSKCQYSINQVDLICNKTGRLWIAISSHYFYTTIITILMKLRHVHCLDLSVQCTLILLQRISVDWNNEYFEKCVIDKGNFAEWFITAVNNQHYVLAVFFSLFVMKRTVSKALRNIKRFSGMKRHSRNAICFMLLIRDLPTDHYAPPQQLQLNQAIREFINMIFSSTLATRAAGALVREYGISWTLQRLRAYQYPREVEGALHRYMFQITWFFVSTYLFKCKCCPREPGVDRTKAEDDDDDNDEDDDSVFRGRRRFCCTDCARTFSRSK